MHRMLVWITPSHEKAGTTWPLCYSTTQPLYQGTHRKAGGTKPRRVTRQKNVERKAVSSSLEEDVTVFRLCSTLNLSCHVPILAYWYFMWQIKLIGKCSGHSLQKYRPRARKKN